MMKKLLGMCLVLGLLGFIGCGEAPGAADKVEAKGSPLVVMQRPGPAPAMSNNWCTAYQFGRCFLWAPQQLPQSALVYPCNTFVAEPSVQIYSGVNYTGTCIQYALAPGQNLGPINDLSFYGWYNEATWVNPVNGQALTRQYRIMSFIVNRGVLELYPAPLNWPWNGGSTNPPQYWSLPNFNPPMVPDTRVAFPNPQALRLVKYFQ